MNTPNYLVPQAHKQTDKNNTRRRRRAVKISKGRMCLCLPVRSCRCVKMLVSVKQVQLES